MKKLSTRGEGTRSHQLISRWSRQLFFHLHPLTNRILSHVSSHDLRLASSDLFSAELYRCQKLNKIQALSVIYPPDFFLLGRFLNHTTNQPDTQRGKSQYHPQLVFTPLDLHPNNSVSVELHFPEHFFQSSLSSLYTRRECKHSKAIHQITLLSSEESGYLPPNPI